MVTYATNPRASFDFHILETLEAGLDLYGLEVKAIKKGHASLRGSYVKIINGQPVLLGATVSPYQPANTPDSYDPQRTRHLLLKKKEVKHLLNQTIESGLAIIPLKLYAKGNLVKLAIGLARGKKKYDKRETIKQREVDKKIKQELRAKI